MELTMVNGFNEMSLDEMREVDGGVAFIPAIVAVGKAIWTGAKVVYATPVGKTAIDAAITTVVGAGVTKLMGVWD